MQTTTTVTKTKERPLNIVIIGLPGCGKGTQSGMLAERYDLVHISSGDLLREQMQHDTPVGRRISEMMDKGTLLSDELVDAVFIENVPSQNYILDGYPRKLSQVDTFPSVNLVLYLVLPEDEAIRRILHRGESRVDDNEDTVRIRLNDFRAKTKPVIDFYAGSARGIFHEVSALGSPEEVFERIEAIIKNKEFN